MNLTWKIGSVIGALGVIGGSATIINQLTKEKQTVKNTLIQVGYHVLDLEKEDNGWDTVLRAYTSISDQPKPLGNITNKKELREKCKKLLNSNLSDKVNYSLASKWCVKEETIRVMLGRNKYKELGDVGTEANKDKWVEKVKLLKIAKDNKIEVDFDNNQDEEKLVNKCKSLDNIKTHADDEFESKFIWMSKWCSEK